MSENLTAERVLRYDATCALCRELAGFVKARSRGLFTVEPLEKAQKDLAFFDGERWHEGPAAWKALLDVLPDLAGLTWLARKLQLDGVLAQGLDATAKRLKWFCKGCGRRV